VVRKRIIWNDNGLITYLLEGKEAFVQMCFEIIAQIWLQLSICTFRNLFWLFYLAKMEAIKNNKKIQSIHSKILKRYIIYFYCQEMSNCFAKILIHFHFYLFLDSSQKWMGHVIPCFQIFYKIWRKKNVSSLFLINLTLST